MKNFLLELATFAAGKLGIYSTNDMWTEFSAISYSHFKFLLDKTYDFIQLPFEVHWSKIDESCSFYSEIGSYVQTCDRMRNVQTWMRIETDE